VPQQRWGSYVKIALVECEPGTQSVAAISLRGRHIRSILRLVTGVYRGTSERCEAAQAESALIARAQAEAKRDARRASARRGAAKRQLRRAAPLPWTADAQFEALALAY